MQEEVEQRIVSLMISCGKLGEQEFRKAVAKLLEQLKNDRQKHQYSKANPHGKMTVKQLAAKDKGLQSIEVTDQNIGSFNRIARKYGIDFAPFKVKGEKRYMVFFKAPDADAMTAAFKEYTAKQVRKAERPSVLEKLQHFKSLIQAAVVDRTKRKLNTMKQVNVKKLILPNIPYVFIALLATKVSEAVRLAPGSDASTKLLNIMTGLNTAFHSLVPSFHPIDLCVGVAAAIAIRLAVYIKGKNAKKFRKNLEYGSARWSA